MEIGTIKAYDTKGNEITSMVICDDDRAGRHPFIQHMQDILNEMLTRLIND